MCGTPQGTGKPGSLGVSLTSSSGFVLGVAEWPREVHDLLIQILDVPLPPSLLKQLRNPVGPEAVADDTSWVADNYGVGWDIAEYYGSCADHCTIADAVHACCEDRTMAEPDIVPDVQLARRYLGVGKS